MGRRLGRSGLCDILIQLVCCDSEGRGGLVLAIVEKDSYAGTEARGKFSDLSESLCEREERLE